MNRKLEIVIYTFVSTLFFLLWKDEQNGITTMMLFASNQ